MLLPAPSIIGPTQEILHGGESKGNQLAQQCLEIGQPRNVLAAETTL